MDSWINMTQTLYVMPQVMTVFFGSQIFEKDRQKNIRNFCEEGSSGSNETVNPS